MSESWWDQHIAKMTRSEYLWLIIRAVAVGALIGDDHPSVSGLALLVLVAGMVGDAVRWVRKRTRTSAE